MTAYIVTVRPGTSDRYTDSLWVIQESAEKRADMLVAEFSRRGRPGCHRAACSDGWGAWVSEIGIEDAKEDIPKPKTEPKK